MVPAPDVGRDPAASAVRARLAVPRQIGPFQILRQIGEGGMGIVFLAQQERPARTVALKVIHASLMSPRTLRRFEQEGDVLARLQHPGIAQVYQVGTYATDQGVLPYIAMEFVEGERLDLCVAKRALLLRERLELAARIADAVEHAHQKGVIHRDLKPGNILVTCEGQPKILDFGVARLSDDDTRTTTLRTDVGALMGTLTYMSPEQAGGDPEAIDTRSDVYSLGVVVYELLTGKLPYYIDRSALPEAVRVIQEEEPTKLSTHARALRGDVETIVRKALEKDRNRRYPTAQAMADDIRRHLANEPIHARAPSAWYQLSKFARRNRILVGGIAAVLATLLAGIATATHLYVRERAASASERKASASEREARLAAESQEKLAQTTAGFLLSLFEGIDPAFARGADTQLLQRILEDARSRLGTELAGLPEVEARIRQTLGVAYSELTLFDEAESELRAALELWRARFGPDDRRSLEAENALASLLTRRGDLAQAEAAQRATLERQESALGPRDPAALQTKHDLGDGLMRQGRLDEAERVLRATLTQQEELLGADDPDVLSTRVSLAHTLNFQSQHAEARELLERVFLERSTRLGDDHPDTIVALETLGGTLRELGELEEAEMAQRDALERARRVWGEDNQQTLAILNNLSITLDTAGKLDESESVLRDCIARRRRVFGDEHVETLGTLNLLATFLSQHGRAAEAEPLILENLATMRRVLGENHRETLRARNSAALLLGRQSRHREAAEHFAAVAMSDRELLREDDPKRSQDLYNWAATLQNADDNAAAEPLLREAIELIDRNGLQAELFVPAARNALAKVLEERAEHAEADALFQAALEERRQRHGSAHREIAYSLSDYGEALLERGDLDAAEPLLAELVEMQEKLLTEDDWRLAAARQLFGRCLARLGRYAEGEAQLLPACEAFARLADALPGAARGARAGILALYAAWDAAEPGQGIAARAERWQTKFPAEE